MAVSGSKECATALYYHLGNSHSWEALLHASAQVLDSLLCLPASKESLRKGLSFCVANDFQPSPMKDMYGAAYDNGSLSNFCKMAADGAYSALLEANL